MNSTTPVVQIATTVRTRKTAVKRANDYLGLSLPLRHQGAVPEIGQDFDIDYWTGSAAVPALLRYDIVPVPDGFMVVSTRTHLEA